MAMKYETNTRKSRLSGIGLFRTSRRTTSFLKKTLFSIRKSLAIFLAAASLLFASFSVYIPPSNAATSQIATTTSSRSHHRDIHLVSSSSSSAAKLDKMINQYVEDHMFTDDKFDPFEDAYREAHRDTILQQNPVADVVDSILTQEGLGKTTAPKFTPFKAIRQIPTRIIDAIVSVFEKMGMDPKVVRAFVAVFVVTFLPVSGGYFLLSFGGFFRKILISQEKNRYGGVSEITAIEKEEEVVEAPEDDEDDEDEDTKDESKDADKTKK